MQTTIVKWGNSQGVRLPKALLQNINVAENDPVEILLENEKIIIRKINKKGHKTTKQRLMEFHRSKIKQNDKPQKEIDWGKPVGNEIW